MCSPCLGSSKHATHGNANSISQKWRLMAAGVKESLTYVAVQDPRPWIISNEANCQPALVGNCSCVSDNRRTQLLTFVGSFKGPAKADDPEPVAVKVHRMPAGVNTPAGPEHQHAGMHSVDTSLPSASNLPLICASEMLVTKSTHITNNSQRSLSLCQPSAAFESRDRFQGML